MDKGYLLGGRYKIIAILGEGGMANVYLAEDIILKQKVAVKILRQDLKNDLQTIQRFQREAMSTSELSHPHIVSILDVGSENDEHYLVMEYVNGVDLKEYIKEHKPLPLKEVISIMDQILDAMALAHDHNVIHRDLKPQNILMDKNGNIKIVDFGIAVALNQSTMTQTNTAMGSVHYMSPEQARGVLATKQSDIYSLGIILYELLMGKVPFTGENAVAIALKHFQENTPSLRKQNPQIPQPLENVVLKATAKDPKDRYKSVYEMKTDLDSCLDPERAGEEVFIDSHRANEEKTIVIPTLSGSVHNGKKETKEVIEEENKKQKNGFWKNVVSHKVWWITAIVAMIAILATMLLALNSKTLPNVPDVSNMTQAQATKKLEKSGLKVGTVKRSYSAGVKKGRVIRTIPGSGTSIRSGKLVNLIISKGQHLVLVPNVTGNTYEVAADRLKKDGFKVEKDQTYSYTTPVGNVISQDITPGEKIDPATTPVKLLISQGPPQQEKESFKIRDLTGYSLKGARDYASDNNLRLEISEIYSDTAEKGTVISQSPKQNTTVYPGDEVKLIVSKGKDENKSSQDSQNSSSKSQQEVKVTKTFSIPYEKTSSLEGDHLQIYVEDDNHSINDVYKDIYIKKDAAISIPFNLSNGNGRVKIVRDGKEILDEEVKK
ncbi:Stk1 family PASTA domain-containing Ser/Thr kinase [Lactobacillus sp. PV012]|uniref:Stk1 family PASTA domain-containing Ser/Thr kinase n=1 Tax=Lactobacillus sp. PV012 TaxID=2594494 RepID=UPI00223EE912|nr:Stk1 family PASTA domain-containing Ser/Thr kinase [Lactobacillus sp. PV012]